MTLNAFVWWIASRPLLAICSNIAAVPVQTAVLTASDQFEPFPDVSPNGCSDQESPFARWEAALWTAPDDDRHLNF